MLEEKPPTITQERWLNLLGQYEPELGVNPRRGDPRYHIAGIATVILHDSETTSRGSMADIIGGSKNGCMLKSYGELKSRIPVTIECCVRDEIFVLHGHVTHSTRTVGGFKTGIKLDFSETTA